MKFNKDDLIMLADCRVGGEGWAGMKIVSDEPHEEHRWEMERRQVFKFASDFYETFYRTPLTEMGSYEPYSYSPDEIECKQVWPTTETITVYVSEKPTPAGPENRLREAIATARGGAAPTLPQVFA